jgi:hypothetical protein
MRSEHATLPLVEPTDADTHEDDVDMGESVHTLGPTESRDAGRRRRRLPQGLMSPKRKQPNRARVASTSQPVSRPMSPIVNPPHTVTISMEVDAFFLVREEGPGNFVEYRFESMDAARAKARRSSYSWVLWDCGDRPFEQWTELDHGGMGMLVGASKTIRAHVKAAYGDLPLQHERAAPGQLVLTVKSASGLQSVDTDHMQFASKSSSESDPYVTVTISRPSALPLHGQTRYRRNTSEPRWNKTFTFDKVESADTRVTIEVMDYEKFGNDRTFAMVEFPLKELHEEMQGVQEGEPVAISRKLGQSAQAPDYVKSLPAGSLGDDAPHGEIHLLVGWRKDTTDYQYVVISEEGINNFVEERFEQAASARIKYTSGFRTSWVLFDRGVESAQTMWKIVVSGGMGIYTGAETRIMRHVELMYFASDELKPYNESASERSENVESTVKETDEQASKREREVSATINPWLERCMLTLCQLLVLAAGTNAGGRLQNHGSRDRGERS